MPDPNGEGEFNTKKIILAAELRTLIPTASSLKYDKISVRKPTEVDPRMILVLDISKAINDVFATREWKRRDNFVGYFMSDNPKTFRFDLLEYYQYKLDADIRSVLGKLRKGGYFIAD